MIQAKEYKIGNWIVDWETEEKYFQIEEIRKYVGYEVWAYYRNSSIKSKKPEPIELSEEILLKCGFQAKNDYENFIFNEIEISSSVRVVSTNERKSFWLVGKYEIRIQYLHQLQNLYFALTNEELTVNL